MLTVDSGGNGDFLPVFGFEEEVEAFLHFFVVAGKKGWGSRQTMAGELVSILMGPCAGVTWVALDPLRLSSSGEMLPLVRVSRERFVQALMGERGVLVEKLTLA